MGEEAVSEFLVHTILGATLTLWLILHIVQWNAHGDMAALPLPGSSQFYFDIYYKCIQYIIIHEMYVFKVPVFVIDKNMEV